MNNERVFTLAVLLSPFSNKNLSIISLVYRCLVSALFVLFHLVLIRGHALLEPHRLFILYDGGIDAEACSRHLGGRPVLSSACH